MATRADNNDGSLKQIHSGKLEGKWRVQYTFIEPNGIKRRLSRVFPTQREGKDFLRSLKRSDDRLAYQAAKEVTFGDWFEWLAKNDWPETLDEKTIRDRRARFKKYAAERWSRIPLSKIDPLDVKAFYNDLRDRGVGEHTRIALKAHLVRAFNQAITPYRRVPHFWGNPFCLDMPVPGRRAAVAISPEDARKAFEQPSLSVSQKAMLGVFLLAGLRLGEQMALTRGQVHEAEALLLVDRSVKLGKTSSQTIGPPKGEKVRTAVICDTLSRLLAPLCDSKTDDEYLWPAATENKPRMKKLVYATWRTIVKDAGLPSEMTPHDCRLSHINWIEKLMPEVSPTTLKEHVGHAAQGVTEVNYTRPITPSQQLLAQAIERVVFPPEQPST